MAYCIIEKLPETENLPITQSVVIQFGCKYGNLCRNVKKGPNLGRNFKFPLKLPLSVPDSCKIQDFKSLTPVGKR